MPLQHRGNRDLRARNFVLSAAALVLFLSACQPLNLPAGDQSAQTSEAEGNEASKNGAQKKDQSEGPQFAEFRDVPIPSNASIDFDNLLILGSEDGWIGRLALRVGYSMPDMYAFYEREMPRFGWRKITSVRAAISTMTYSRGNRIATVTLQSRTTGGTAIDFTVAPTNPLAEQSALPGALPSPAPKAPAI